MDGYCHVQIYTKKDPALHSTDQWTNLSLEYGFNSNASNEVEPDDVKNLQDQQQPVEQIPGLVWPSHLPAVKQNTVYNPITNRNKHTGYWSSGLHVYIFH